MKNNKQIQLAEYEYIFIGKKDKDKHKAVNKKTFKFLENFILKNENTVQYLKLGFQKKYGKVLQAQNYVGVIQTKDGVTIEILPKIQKNLKKQSGKKDSKKILLRMLKTLKNTPFKNFNIANLKSSNVPLLEIFISMFLDELLNLIKKGIKSDYIIKEENLKFLKGKLLINQQIKYNYIHKERFFVEYQDFVSDRIENRIIKTTLKYLYKKSKFNRNQQRIREFLFIFDEISICQNIKVGFDKVNSNREMRNYKQTLLWCKIFLQKNSFSPYKGNDIAFALLFDMNKLFENYIFYLLKKYGDFTNIQAQDNIHHLAYLNGEEEKFQLKPDIVIDNGRIIADTKWKLLNKTENKTKNNQGVEGKDMYQLYAYGTKYSSCESMYLIYPNNGQNIIDYYEFFKDNQPKQLTLKIVFADVSEKKEQDIIANIKELINI